MNDLGTKLRCTTCGAQAVVIKAGDGTLRCHGGPMEVVAGAADAATQALRDKARASAPDDPD